MKDRKIYCLNPIAGVGLERLREGYEITDDINEAAGILVRSADMKEMEFPACLRAVARAGAGVNNIPLDRCAEAGIVVFNTPGANANGVKELVVAGLMLASRDIAGGIEWVRNNVDDPSVTSDAEKAKKAFAGTEIKGKRLGVIGLGAIGVMVANTAWQLGMDVYGYDPYISVGAAWNLRTEIKHCENIDDVFEKCDYITIHVPAMESTKGMINAEAISKMKEGVFVLNYARDTLVDDDAMAAALESGKVAKYVMDFPNAKTVNMKNCIVTPHLGASTEESENNCAVMATEELQDYLDNGNIRHSVNYPDLDAGVCRTESRIACLHENIPGMLSNITSTMGKENVNIANLYNKSRDKFAYTLIDLDERITDEALDALKNIKGMRRVRIVK
ncbi:MAG: phosphoglycerate dehydrogenase [Lachnospiraceae bacterium]|nr:phosphoglycerate dehydrogenase [Candidatus Darwinimomas equi]